MIRRVVHACAALAVFAVASLVWTPPAAAAPGGPCSLEEWRSPSNFADCTRRLAAGVGQEAGCVSAPTPGSPTSGMPGWFAAQPDSALRDGVTGQYSRYGVGGYGLDTYDIGCLGTVKHPDLVAWNNFASMEFSWAASVMGAANALRSIAYEPGSIFDGWSDRLIEAAVDAVYEHVFTTFGAVALAVLGGFLIWRSRHGQLSKDLQLVGWALLVLTATTALARWPVTAANGADQAAATVLRGVHSVLGPGPQHIPANECVLGGEACRDNRTVAVRASDVATDAVLYRPWLRAMLGTADSATARKYGPALYDATTLSWGEAARAEQSPALRKQVIEQKAQTWNTLAQQIRTEDPLAYEHLQGVHGSDRFGNGAIALGSAVVFAAFDMAASTVILFGFLVFRVAIILFPLLATVGMFMPASAGLRRAFHMSTAAFFNIGIFGAAAGLYLTAADLIFSSALPGFVQFVLVTLVGAVCWVLLRPVRQLVHTATGRSRAAPSLPARLFRAGRQISSGGVAPTSPAPAGSGPAAPRPEHQPTRARLLFEAAAPTVASAVRNPGLATVLNVDRPETASTQRRPSRPRPENRSRP